MGKSKIISHLASSRHFAYGASKGGGMKVRLNGPGYMTKMAAMPIYGKTLQKSSLEPVGQLPWNLVCSIGDSGILYFVHWWPWVDLDQFYANVKFGHFYICMEKSENCWLFINSCSQLSQSWYMQSIKWVHEATWETKVKVTPWPLTKVAQILKSKLVIPRNYWTSWNQILYESSSEKGNENPLYEFSLITKMAALTYIFGY